MGHLIRPLHIQGRIDGQENELLNSIFCVLMHQVTQLSTRLKTGIIFLYNMKIFVLSSLATFHFFFGDKTIYGTLKTIAYDILLKS